MSNDEKLFGKDKDVARLDPFFVEVEGTDGTEVDKASEQPNEKRAVMRDGRVPKFQKNLVKMQQY